MYGMIVLCCVAAVPLPDIVPPSDPPERMPSRPLPAQEAARRESLTRFGLGLLRQSNDRPVDAVSELEAAVKLAPQAVEPRRPLVRLYRDLGRDAAAIRTAERILELDPDDADTAQLLGQLHFEGKEYSQAARVFQQAARSSRLHDRPEQRLAILRDWCRASRAAGDWPGVEAAARETIQHVKKAEAVLKQAPPYDEPGELSRLLATMTEQLGRAYAAQHQFVAATEAYRDAARQFADRQGANDSAAAARLGWNLALLLEQQGEFAASLRALESYLRFGPESTDPYLKLSELLKKLGRSEQIVPRLQQLTQLHPNLPAINWVLATELGRIHPAEGNARLRKLAKQTTDPAFFRLAVSYFRQTDQTRELLALLDSLHLAARGSEDDQANRDRNTVSDPEAVARVRALHQAIQQEPGLTALLLRSLGPAGADTVQLSADTWELLGWLAKRDRLWLAAEQAFRQALATETNSRHVRSELLELLAIQRKWTELRRECSREIAQNPGRRSLIDEVYLAQALAELNRGEEALAVVERLRTQVSAAGLVWARLQKVRILNLLGHHAEAVDECQAILTDHPDPAESAPVRYQLADSYAGMKQYQKAEAELRLILDRDPDDILALNNLGYMLAEQNRKLAEAETLIRRAIALDRRERLRLGHPEAASGIYLDSLGWVLFRQGKFAEARRCLEEAVNRPDSGSDAIVWDHLGDVAFRMGDQSRAAQAWRKAAELYDNSRLGRSGDRLTEVKRKLKFLE